VLRYKYMKSNATYTTQGQKKMHLPAIGEGAILLLW
jgi:hypothetical protein